MFGNGARKKRAQKRNSAKRSAPVGGGNDTVHAVQELQKRIQTLEKRHKFLELKSNNMKTKARQDVANKDKSAALHKLQQKKIIDKEASTLAASILKLQEQISELQLTATTGDIVDAMRLGANAQKKLQKKLNADDVEDLLADIEDMKLDNQEVTDLLSADYADVDPDLEAEFEELMADDLEQNINIQIPAVPNTAVSSSAKEDADAEFEKLLAGLEAAPSHAPKPPVKVAETTEEQELAALEANFL
uniref:Charged multivesicular body protein 4b n=1 Tax=Aplanochytrium stocchinoi TaxID=215587 RepID=A0A7S3PGF7_9STRA|mmetsp:Transcript_13630/g.16906  ORF Transcript_13630/g.16906 Transcript_13630/m.16906 type:complete len:247 (+) Transcript_13630:268-1008(+)